MYCYGLYSYGLYSYGLSIFDFVRQVCIDMRMDTAWGISVDMSTDTCLDVRTVMSTDMCLDVYIDMWRLRTEVLGICILRDSFLVCPHAHDALAHTHTRTYMHSHIHAHAHAHTRVQVNQLEVSKNLVLQVAPCIAVLNLAYALGIFIVCPECLGCHMLA